MRRIALKIAYDGAAYGGWQRQEEVLSIQQTLEDTVERVFGEKVRIMGSGRTDAGVHAEAQVAAMDLKHPVPVRNLILALNSNLPEDIRIMAAAETDSDFQPQFSAKRKTYVYRFFNGPVMPPDLRRTVQHVPERLDVSRMRACLPMLLGEHDFASFRASGAVNLTTVRTLYEVSLTEKEGAAPGAKGTLYEFRVCGNGFLYNMVRIMMGALLTCGKGRIPPENIQKALEETNRELLGPTAPALGLTMVSVEYDKEISWITP